MCVVCGVVCVCGVRGMWWCVAWYVVVCVCGRVCGMCVCVVCVVYVVCGVCV